MEKTLTNELNRVDACLTAAMRGYTYRNLAVTNPKASTELRLAAIESRLLSLELYTLGRS